MSRPSGPKIGVNVWSKLKTVSTVTLNITTNSDSSADKLTTDLNHKEYHDMFINNAEGSVSTTNVNQVYKLVSVFPDQKIFCYSFCIT
jgi:hypothetical protein